MPKEKKMIPEIRFPGFSDPWEQRKLSEACKLNGRIGFRGYTEKDIISKEQGGVLTFSPTNIIDNTLTTECRNTYITREKYEESPEIMIKNGDILFVKTGSTLGKSALVMGLSEDATINPQIVVLRTQEGTEKFFSTVLITRSILKQVAAVKIGGAVPTMTETELKNFSFMEPTCFEEKTKIGAFFDNLDNLIALHQRKYESLKKLKKGMLQKMFPKEGSSFPEIRFPGFSDPWEQCKLGELMNVTSVKRIHQSDWTDSGVRFLRARDIVAASKNEEPDDYLYISKEKYEEYSALSGKVDIDDLLVTGVGTIGVPYLVENLEPLYFKDGNIIWFQNQNEIDGKFLYYSFIGNGIQSFIKASAGTGTVGTYTIDTGKKTPIQLPSKEEQKKIGDYLSQLDNLITLHQRKCDSLKKLKNGLLQKMFI